MTRVLVAARGTTAVRVAQSVRRAGMSPVGVVVPVERDATWTRVMDDLLEVSAYDDATALVSAATALDARLLHPGVGFAAESPGLARACAQAGLTWVGPSPQALEGLSDKAALAELLRDLGIPAPRTSPVLRGPEDLVSFASEVAAPLVLKTVHGGGGRGVVRLSGRGQARGAWREASGLGRLIAQEEVRGARHVEVQALGDGTGRVLAAGTRECSLQRRSQKVLEEAPAVGLPQESVTAMESATRRLLGHVSYRGVATCEFLVSEDSPPLLLEVNARLQVEHALTEEVTGTDLVLAQIRLAQGQSLGQVLGEHRETLPVTGHAVEVRLYAEDPSTLTPSQEGLRALRLPVSLACERSATARGERPSLPRLRVQQGTFLGDAIQPGFSEPLALLCAVAASRQKALDHLGEALDEVSVSGPLTLLPLLRDLLQAPEVRDPRLLTTTWLEEHLDLVPSRPPDDDAVTVRDDVAGGAGYQLVTGREEIRSPMAASVVERRPPGPVRRGEVVAVLEAMKMRLPVPAPRDGVLLAPATPAEAPTDTVRAGELLGAVEYRAPATCPAQGGSGPRARPRGRSALTRARELADPGSLTRLVDEDAVLTARARLAGREVALWAQDPTVRGGTIGLSGARRVAELVDEAAREHLPVVSLLDGGGARVQEGVDALAGVGLVLAAQTRARGRTLQVGLVLGSAAGGAAYSPALADVMVMVEGAGRVFLTGPAVLASTTGEEVDAEALGGSRLHAEQAGTTHLSVADEPSAWQAARELVGFAPLRVPDGTALPLRAGGAGAQVVPSDSATGEVLPPEASTPYDVRRVLERITDRGEVLVLREGWAPSVLTALAHLQGVPLGVVATQPALQAGAVTAEAAQKVREHLDLCAGLGLPVLTVLDTPGFLPGTESEQQGVVRHGAALVDAYARYRDRGIRLLTLITRRAYGGAYVALGSTPLSGARSLAWPGALVGVMDAGSAIALVHRRELAQAACQDQDGSGAASLREDLIERQEAAQSAQAAVEAGWVEELVEPGRTRARLVQLLTEAGPDVPVVRPAPATSHPGDGWVSCGCGARHWGLNGAAGALLWRRREEGTEVLLQLRAPWTHHGGTWGLPGGAVADSESTAEGALREIEEETGLPAREVVLGGSHVQTHPGWSYTTYSARVQDDPARDVLVPVDGESSELRWVVLEPSGEGTWHAPRPRVPDDGATNGAKDSVRPEAPLLPALELAWQDIARLLPAPGQS